MYTRKWLEEELAKHRHWEDHCWTSVVPLLRHSCVGHMQTAQELFNSSNDEKDLQLWIIAINRAEEYVDAKDKKRPYGKFGIEDKTGDHKKYIEHQRTLITDGEWKLLLTKIENEKVSYDRAKNKPELKTWKASLEKAKKFLQENKRDNELLTPELNTYNRAEKEYNKQNSCITRCFLWCAPDVEEPSGVDDETLNENRNPYIKLPGRSNGQHG